MIYNLLIAALFPVCLTGSCVGNRVHPTEGGAKQESVAQGIVQSHVEQHPEEKKIDVLQQTLYTQADSARVEALLRENPGENDVLFYARKFIGVPYVAATLEKSDPEQLVVNLRQMDCTTLVETTLALTLAITPSSRMKIFLNLFIYIPYYIYSIYNLSSLLTYHRGDVTCFPPLPLPAPRSFRSGAGGSGSSL